MASTSAAPAPAAGAPSSLPDALSTLRASLPLTAACWSDAAGVSVESARATHLQLSAHLFPRSTPTRLVRPSAPESATPSTAPQHFYALDDLVFAHLSRDESYAAYLLAANRTEGMAGRHLNALERPRVLRALEQEGEMELSEAELQRRLEAPSSSTAPAAQAAAAPKRAYVPSPADAAFVKRLRTQNVEVVLRTRTHALRGPRAATGAAVDFATAHKALAPLLRGATAGGPQSAPSARGAAAPAAGGAPKRRRGDPIIVLSNAPTALIGLSNLAALLGGGMYVPRSAGAGGGETMISLERPGLPNGLRQRFLVVDSTEALARLGAGGADPWERVVAVFTSGQMWQFKGYKWSEPRELFRHVMGVYVRWANDARAPSVRDWNVTELAVDRTKRHTDKQLVAHFWRSLDAWVARNKPDLAPRGAVEAR